jgi:LysM repeat protein
MLQDKPDFTLSVLGSGLALSFFSALFLAPSALAQNFPISGAQKATAAQVAQTGVPLSELAPNAPDHYTVRPGDTLWAISALFLTSPWRWPELWGMNYTEIANPHLIFPGQQLFLEKKNGLATLTTQAPASQQPATVTLRLSPRTRVEAMSASALPTLRPGLIEAFLTEPNIVNENELLTAPRIVATQEGRVLLSRGDRAYVRGPAGAPLTDTGSGPQVALRVFRNATPLYDPETRAVLGYEAQYVGKALLVRSEVATPDQPSGESPGLWDRLRGLVSHESAVPPTAASVDIVEAKEEMRVGDRLLPEPPRQIRSFVPRSPEGPVAGRIVSVSGSGVVNAAQNQVVVISRGSSDGLKTGDVLAILKDGATLTDRTDPGMPTIKLPNERNGLMMVFRPFDKLSYALILEITDGVKVGDRFTNPR